MAPSPKAKAIPSVNATPARLIVWPEMFISSIHSLSSDVPGGLYMISETTRLEASAIGAKMNCASEIGDHTLPLRARVRIRALALSGSVEPLPIELALGARARGMKTVAITNRAQSFAWPARHVSGKRLAEVADVVIDNCGVDGDAAVDLPGFPHRIGPPSSITGMLIINLVIVHAIELAVERGCLPEVFISSNTSGDDHNDLLLQKYRSHIRHL